MSVSGEEIKLEIEGLQKQLAKLQGTTAKIEGDMASSWALQTREDYEKAFKDRIQQELNDYIFKLMIAVVLALAGTGYVFVKYVVTDVYENKNNEKILEFQATHDKLIKSVEKRYEWNRLHNYGNDLANLAEFYQYLEVKEPREKDVAISNLLTRAESYFNQALRLDPKQGSTYWELGELKYSLPRTLKMDKLVNIEEAIENYENAIRFYTDADRAKGWKGDCYFKLGEIMYYRAKAGSGKEDVVSARERLDKARNEYETSTEGNSILIRENLGKINEMIKDLAKL